MARTTRSMLTWVDMADMVSLESFQAQADEPALPANLYQCALPQDILDYLVCYIDGTYAANQLVPWQDVKRGIISDPIYLAWLSTGSSKSLLISCPNGWTASESVSWLSLSATSGTGDTTITVTATTNAGALRTTNITLTDTTTAATYLVAVTQAAASGVPTQSIDLATQLGSSAEACAEDEANYETHYISGTFVWATCTGLWTNSLGTIAAPAGWYGEGVRSRYWNGSNFTSTILC